MQITLSINIYKIITTSVKLPADLNISLRNDNLVYVYYDSWKY